MLTVDVVVEDVVVEVTIDVVVVNVVLTVVVVDGRSVDSNYRSYCQGDCYSG